MVVATPAVVGVRRDGGASGGVEGSLAAAMPVTGSRARVAVVVVIGSSGGEAMPEAARLDHDDE